MSITMIKAHAHAEKTEAVKEPSRPCSSNQDGRTIDAGFEAFMQQLLGTIISNSTAPAADTAPTATAQSLSTDGLQMPQKSALDAQNLTPESTLEQTASAQSPVNQTPDAGARNAEAFREAVETAEDQVNQPPVSRQTLQGKKDEQQGSPLPTVSEQAQEELYGTAKTDYRGIAMQREISENMERAEIQGGVRPQEKAAVVEPRSDFSAFAQQQTPAAQEASGAAQQGVGTAADTHRIARGDKDAAELFDSAALIMKDGTRLAVRLEPEGLGKLDINVSLEKGMVNTQIQVSDAATKALLENNMQHIVNSLLNEGLAVGGFSVGMDNGASWNRTADEGRAAGRGRDDAPTTAAIETSMRNTVQGQLSIFV
jgi:flagellar hook-length control protein FliK